MKYIKQYVKKNYMLILCSVLILLICFFNGIGAKYLVDFYPINGTFQNYNPVRRWLGGQVPARDFSTYLGYGHLILGSIMTWFFGGDYAASLCAFSFLTLLSTAIISYVIGKSILSSCKSAQICTVIFLVFLISDFVFIPGDSVLNTIFEVAFLYGQTPGNSARFIRGLAPALYVCMVEGIFWCIKRSKYYKIAKPNVKKLLEMIVISSVSGLFFLYSNDYGISTWICVGIVYIFVEFCKERNPLTTIKLLIGYLAVSSMSIIIFVMLITHGHFPEWLSATFGTGGFQTWYYLAPNNYYVYNVDFTFLMMLQALLVIYYGICIFRCKAEATMCKRYGVPLLMNMVAFCAANEYRLISGGYLHEVAYAVLTFTIGYEIILVIRKIAGRERIVILSRKIALFAIIFGGAWSISYGVDRGIASLDYDRGTYVEEMGGYMSNLAEDVIDAKNFLGGGKKVFSTYASALETVTNQYQPSGYDYIIHVLGDDAREEYIESFREKDFDYVTTIRAEYTDWENWIRNANWFFYRELYANYHPVYSNSYTLFWEENESTQHDMCVEGSKAVVEVQKLNDSQSKIVVTYIGEDIDGVADIKLTYHSDKAHISKRENLMWFSCINVNDTTPYQIYSSTKNTFNLPKEGSVNIPITLIDGEGEVIISSIPDLFTKLYIDEVSCEQMYKVTFSYIDLVGQAVQISDEDCIISVDKNNLKNKIVEKISKVILGGESWSIVNVSSDDEYIYLTLKGDANKFNAYLGNENVVRVK